MNIKKPLLICLGFLICLLPLGWGIFHPGLFVSDDGHWMVIRLSAFYEALTSGQFPVRMLPRLNNGYGYPVADFLYPLFLYIGSFLHVFKLSFLLDVKVILFGSFFFSTIGAYLYFRKFFSTLASFIGGLLYVYLPYHLYDLYVRGSVGEIVALTIVPFAFWAVEKKSWKLVALFIALLITAHNTLALFFLPILIVYAILRKAHYKEIILFTVLGLGLSTFFWLPALFDRQFTIFESIAVSNPFIYFVNVVSYQLIGWITLAIFLAVMFTKSFLKNKVVIFFFIVGFVSLFFSLSISSIFWHSKQLIEFVQFPFRFLSITLLAEAFLGASIIETYKKNKILVSIFILILAFSALPYLLPKQYDMNPESFYDTNVSTTTVKNEYMPKEVKNLPAGYAYQRVVLADPSSSVVNINQKGTRLSFASQASKSTRAVISFVYFPGWNVTLDGKKVAIQPNANGLLSFPIPQGTHDVKIWYGQSLPQMIADSISLISGILIIGLLFKRKL